MDGWYVQAKGYEGDGGMSILLCAEKGIVSDDREYSTHNETWARNCAFAGRMGHSHPCLYCLTDNIVKDSALTNLVLEGEARRHPFLGASFARLSAFCRIVPVPISCHSQGRNSATVYDLCISDAITSQPYLYLYLLLAFCPNGSLRRNPALAGCSIDMICVEEVYYWCIV